MYDYDHTKTRAIWFLHNNSLVDISLTLKSSRQLAPANGLADWHVPTLPSRRFVLFNFFPIGSLPPLFLHKMTRLMDWLELMWRDIRHMTRKTITLCNLLQNLFHFNRLEQWIKSTYCMSSLKFCISKDLFSMENLYQTNRYMEGIYSGDFRVYEAEVQYKNAFR